MKKFQAIIIGRETKKLLFLGVRNKYCSICARAANHQISPGIHTCFKNWNGSSSAMEADIIVEGFCRSIEMHHLRYKTFIADGDSSVYSKIMEKVPYGREVAKIECVNHTVKNYGKALRKIKIEKAMSPVVKKALTENKIKELEGDCHKSIRNNSATKNLDLFRRELINEPRHVFGDHRLCKANQCNQVAQFDPHTVSLETNGLFMHISGENS